MHYTSGTTGKPKGAVHAHIAALQHMATGQWALDLHDEDIWQLCESRIDRAVFIIQTILLNAVEQLVFVWIEPDICPRR